MKKVKKVKSNGLTKNRKNNKDIERNENNESNELANHNYNNKQHAAHKKIKNKNKQKCVFHGCSHYSKKNGYCKKHVSEWKIHVEQNNARKVCGYYKRGCINIIDINNDFDICDTCKTNSDNNKLLCSNHGKYMDEALFIGNRNEITLTCNKRRDMYKRKDSRPERKLKKKLWQDNNSVKCSKYRLDGRAKKD